MQLIDGIGDEVVHFAAAVVVVLVAALAWWSTNARMDRYRTILLRQRADHPVTMSIRSNTAPLTMLYNNRQTNASGTSLIETASVTSGVTAVSTRPTGARGDVVPLQEMDSIVDADMALLENNRLHFYRRIITSPRADQIEAESTTDTETDSQEDAEPASNAQIREMDSIVSAMEADETNDCNVFTRPHENNPNPPTTLRKRRHSKQKDKEPQSESNSEDTATNAEDVTDNTNEASDRKILIRLKYLNDTLKEVDGNLDELLKDFKCRHFATELSSSRVRLIFNGRVLCDEAATLRALGLHHMAVVHCLVHPNRNNTQRGPGEEGGAVPALEGAPREPTERVWDLENILMTLVSIALTIVWFFRCEYSNMFTASASVALFGLTLFYSLAIFGLYMSDTFHVDRRPPPLTNN